MDDFISEDGDMEPLSVEVRNYQELLRSRAANWNLKKYSDKFREKIVETRDWDERDRHWVFSEDNTVKTPGKDHKGAPLWTGTSMTGSLGRDRYLEQLRRWNEAHLPPAIENITMRHVLRVDDRIKAIRGKDYALTKPPVKTRTTHRKKQEDRAMSHGGSESDLGTEDPLAIAIKKWDRYVTAQFDDGEGLAYAAPVARRHTVYVDEPLAQEEFVMRRQSTVQKRVSVKQ
jgi:hypothetical protein